VSTQADKDQNLKDLCLEKGVHLSNTDRGNVLLFNILTLNERYQKQNNKELDCMIKLHDTYAKRGLSIIGIFAYDLESGE